MSYKITRLARSDSGNKGREKTTKKTTKNKTKTNNPLSLQPQASKITTAVFSLACHCWLYS